MFFLQATPAQRVPETELILALVAREPVIPPRVRTPATLDDARQVFAEFKGAAQATGQGAYVRGFWQASSRIGGPKRAPKGLKDAEAKGEFRAHVNV